MGVFFVFGCGGLGVGVFGDGVVVVVGLVIVVVFCGFCFWGEFRYWWICFVEVTFQFEELVEFF